MKNIMLVEYCHHIGCRVRQHIGSYVPWSAYQGLSPQGTAIINSEYTLMNS
jgi:hypothetical protein